MIILELAKKSALFDRKKTFLYNLLYKLFTITSWGKYSYHWVKFPLAFLQLQKLRFITVLAGITRQITLRFSKTIGLVLVFKINPLVWVIYVLLCFTWVLGMYF